MKLIPWAANAKTGPKAVAIISFCAQRSRYILPDLADRNKMACMNELIITCLYLEIRKGGNTSIGRIWQTFLNYLQVGNG